MLEWLWQDGHLTWGVFSVLVYTGILILVADLGWRLVTRPAWQIALAVILIWSAGVAALIAVTSS